MSPTSAMFYPRRQQNLPESTLEGGKNTGMGSVTAQALSLCVTLSKSRHFSKPHLISPSLTVWSEGFNVVTKVKGWHNAHK
jgi:hypothetical protein